MLRGTAVVFGVITLTFLLLHLAPGDPVQRLLGPAATPEQIEAARRTAGWINRCCCSTPAGWVTRWGAISG